MDETQNLIKLELTETEYKHYLTYKQKCENQKEYLKNYHKSDVGREKRKIAQKKYRLKVKKKTKLVEIKKTKDELLTQLKMLEEEEFNNSI